jgi:hypothetical protein
MKSFFCVSVILSALLLAGCETTFCDHRGYSLAISNPPADILFYDVLLEFENQTIEFECSIGSAKPTECETSQGPWTVTVFLAALGHYAAGIRIENGDEFTSRVPRGQIRVVLTSPDRPDFFAEHVSEPEIGHQTGSPDCEFASEIWDLEGS